MAAAALAALLAVLAILEERELIPSALGAAHRAIYAIVVGAAVVAACAPAAWRRLVLIAATVVATPFALGWWSLALAGYIAAVIALVRAPLSVASKLAITLALWLTVPVLRMFVLDADAQADTIVLAMIWVGQLYSTFYVIIEREREPPERRPGVVSDVFYLAALPRIAVPYFQPISPSLIAARERPRMPWRVIARGAGLGAWGVVSAIAAWRLVQTVRTIRQPTVHAIAHHRLVFELLRFVAGYAHLTYTIFLAVAVYRLLGFELPSGYRRPFLSQSFGEFFRSFNHYVRDAVLSLFYFPILGHLRHHARPRLATIGAAYASIVIGSFLLHDLLVPFAISVEPVGTFAFFLDPVRVASMVAMWTLIIVPNAGIAPRRRAPRSRLRIVASVIVFNLLYFALWLALREGRGWFHTS
ncbi:MAG TPA: hypothetical protein VH165_36760 [Kofleriaceae bacterium]|nr:hypothetical protein [Kofleriaceae bacterium]